MTTCDIAILGAAWEISICEQGEDERLEDIDGYTDWTTRKIAVYNAKPDKDSVADLSEHLKKVIRHEIVHAFLYECGLAECSCAVESWAHNEEMVDWFAYRGPQIYKAWQEAGAL